MLGKKPGIELTPGFDLNNEKVTLRHHFFS
jgi:hypothetical protein